jgi:hypothetical protein
MGIAERRKNMGGKKELLMLLSAVELEAAGVALQRHHLTVQENALREAPASELFQCSINKA